MQREGDKRYMEYGLETEQGGLQQAQDKRKSAGRLKASVWRI
jgi:hypothetical protein